MAGEWQSCVSPDPLEHFGEAHQADEEDKKLDKRQRVSKHGEVFLPHLSTEGSSGQASDPVWLL